jgi:hypothetical protein
VTAHAILAHLYALRAQIDAVIVAAESDVGQLPQVREPGSCPQCGATPDKVEDRSTLDGTKRNGCTQCGYEWERFQAQV